MGGGRVRTDDDRHLAGHLAGLQQGERFGGPVERVYARGLAYAGLCGLMQVGEVSDLLSAVRRRLPRQ